jgi:hypothetical protein
MSTPHNFEATLEGIAYEDFEAFCDALYEADPEHEDILPAISNGVFLVAFYRPEPTLLEAVSAALQIVDRVHQVGKLRPRVVSIGPIG